MATVTQDDYDAIPWAEVESSNIERVAWERTGTSTLDPDVEIGTLHVEFGSSPGRAYRYVNVPKAIHEDFVGAQSVGSFFANNIKGRYEHERVEVDG